MTGNSKSTLRQIEKVHQGLLQGLSVKEIAQDLDRSIKTVNTHKYRIRSREGADNDVQLLRAYLSKLGTKSLAGRSAEYQRGYRQAIADALGPPQC